MNRPLVDVKLKKVREAGDQYGSIYLIIVMYIPPLLISFLKTLIEMFLKPTFMQKKLHKSSQP